MLAQEYVEGPAFSIEVIGVPGSYTPLQVTELQMDDIHDCKRVLAPAGLDLAHLREFEDMAIRIAERIGLRGLMDVEVILHDGQLKLLEVDARIPSQTPTTVFHSTGINMVELLGDLFLTGRMGICPASPPHAAFYEHIQVTGDQIEVTGEHSMSKVGPLNLFTGLFGADEVISHLHPDLDAWTATLILKGEDRQAVLAKRQQTYSHIRSRSCHA